VPFIFVIGMSPANCIFANWSVIDQYNRLNGNRVGEGIHQKPMLTHQAVCLSLTAVYQYLSGIYKLQGAICMWLKKPALNHCWMHSKRGHIFPL